MDVAVIADTLKEEMEMNLKNGLYHLTQIQFAYNSNHIEGSRLTNDQTRYIYETNTIDTIDNGATNVDDIIETVNHFACFRYILAHIHEELTEHFVKEIHKILKSSTSDASKDWFKVGDYKTRANMVGNKNTAHPNKVGAEMEKLLASYNSRAASFEDIVGFHYDFERIHPFQDGNGRVGRLIMFKECLKNSVFPFIIEDEYKYYYYRGLAEWPTEKGYLLDTCLHAQDSYAKTVAEFFPDI